MPDFLFVTVLLGVSVYKAGVRVLAADGLGVYRLGINRYHEPYLFSRCPIDIKCDFYRRFIYAYFFVRYDLFIFFL